MPELFQATFGDWRFVAVALVALIAGLVRGFSGFGAAMIFVPIAAALYSPQTAVVLLYVTDGVVTLPLVLRALRHCDWREVAPLALGATLTYPLGLKLLLAIDAVPMRWTISALVLGLVGTLASGWRYRRRPGLAGTVTVGGASGLAGGMTGIGGPPVVLFWLAGQGLAPLVRANILVYFGITTVVGGVLYLFAGLFTLPRLVGALGLLPVYAVAIFLGVKAFRFASERVYRRLALTLCAAAALVGLPLWA
jgi:hypothetical protein